MLADPAFMAVGLGADAHEVLLVFEPPWPVAIADGISTLGWGLVLLLGLAWMWRGWR